MYSFEVVNNSLMTFFHEVILALSMCLFRWIKVDKQDYLKKGSRDFKNYFYFGIKKVPSISGTCQKLHLVFQPFRSRSKQCVRLKYEVKYEKSCDDFTRYYLRIVDLIYKSHNDQKLLMKYFVFVFKCNFKWRHCDKVL